MGLEKSRDEENYKKHDCDSRKGIVDSGRSASETGEIKVEKIVERRSKRLEGLGESSNNEQRTENGKQKRKEDSAERGIRVYRKSRHDSYRKRCGRKAVPCSVTAVPSKGALLLVFRLVHPLVLVARRVLRIGFLRVTRNSKFTQGLKSRKSERRAKFKSREFLKRAI